MAGKRNAPAKKKQAKAKPELIYEEGFWWVISGNKRLNVGRNKRYAERVFADVA